MKRDGTLCAKQCLVAISAAGAINTMDNQNLQKRAENLFLNTDKSQKEIAEQLGVDPKTLYRWIRQGHWRELKSATRRMPSILVENIYAQLDDMNFSIAQRDRGNRFPTKDESLTINRLINSIERVKKQTSQGQNIEFMMNFINWLMPQNHELADTLLDYSSGFLKGTEVNGFHPYDIEYQNEDASAPHSRHCEEPGASGDGATKQSHDNTDVLLPGNTQQPELPFPNNCHPEPVSGPHGNIGMAESSPSSRSTETNPDCAQPLPAATEIGHEAGIEETTFDQSHSIDNQLKTSANTETPVPEMPENIFSDNRANEIHFHSRHCEVCLGLSVVTTKQSHDNTNLIALDQPQCEGEVPDDMKAPRKKKKRPEPEYPINPKLIYPGSGVHYLRKKKGNRRPLSKEDYDNLFRPDENKPKPRNERW